MSEKDLDFGGSMDDFINELENVEQPTCNLDDPENCESCSG